MRLASKGGIAAKRSDLSYSPLTRKSRATNLDRLPLVDIGGVPVSATHSWR